MLRIGFGYDVHRFSPDRRLILGGVRVDFSLGLLGHSDADVLIHAIIDALLGAAGMRDIGKLFPDNDIKYKDADSLKLLEEVCKIIYDKGYKIGNIDSTIIAQKPKLEAYIPKMRENIAKVCDIGLENINIKASTEEGLGFTGSIEGIKAYAVCLLG